MEHETQKSDERVQRLIVCMATVSLLLISDQRTDIVCSVGRRFSKINQKYTNNSFSDCPSKPGDVWNQMHYLTSFRTCRRPSSILWMVTHVLAVRRWWSQRCGASPAYPSPWASSTGCRSLCCCHPATHIRLGMMHRQVSVLQLGVGPRFDIITWQEMDTSHHSDGYTDITMVLSCYAPSR